MRAIAVFILATLLVGVAPIDARPRRGAPKPVEHYTFAPERLHKQLEPLHSDHEYVVVLNERHATVEADGALCRIEWSGRRVDALTSPVESWSMEIPLPRGATVREVSAYVIDDNGKDGRKVTDPSVSIDDRVLSVAIDDLDDKRIIEVVYELEGVGITVDESFHFQRDVPVLSAEYSFAVARDLPSDGWEPTSTTSPANWASSSKKTDDALSWRWRETNVSPADASDEPVLVHMATYLPAPALKQLDPDALPAIDQYDAILELEELLRSQATGDYADDAILGGDEPPKKTAPTPSGGTRY